MRLKITTMVEINCTERIIFGQDVANAVRAPGLHGCQYRNRSTCLDVWCWRADPAASP
jgi:hypothetical protein